jgi:hypothetical protein
MPSDISTMYLQQTITKNCSTTDSALMERAHEQQADSTTLLAALPADCLQCTTPATQCKANRLHRDHRSCPYWRTPRTATHLSSGLSVAAISCGWSMRPTEAAT